MILNPLQSKVAEQSVALFKSNNNPRMADLLETLFAEIQAAPTLPAKVPIGLQEAVRTSWYREKVNQYAGVMDNTDLQLNRLGVPEDLPTYARAEWLVDRLCEATEYAPEHADRALEKLSRMRGELRAATEFQERHAGLAQEMDEVVAALDEANVQDGQKLPIRIQFLIAHYALLKRRMEDLSRIAQTLDVNDLGQLPEVLQDRLRDFRERFQSTEEHAASLSADLGIAREEVLMLSARLATAEAEIDRLTHESADAVARLADVQAVGSGDERAAGTGRLQGEEPSEATGPDRSPQEGDGRDSKPSAEDTPIIAAESADPAPGGSGPTSRQREIADYYARPMTMATTCMKFVAGRAEVRQALAACGVAERTKAEEERVVAERRSMTYQEQRGMAVERAVQAHEASAPPPEAPPLAPEPTEATPSVPGSPKASALDSLPPFKPEAPAQGLRLDSIRPEAERIKAEQGEFEDRVSRQLAPVSPLPVPRLDPAAYVQAVDGVGRGADLVELMSRFLVSADEAQGLFSWCAAHAAALMSLKRRDEQAEYKRQLLVSVQSAIKAAKAVAA